MDERILKWLFDIRIAMEEIDSFYENRERSFVAYQKDILLKRDLSFVDKIKDAKSVIGLRNHVIHAYDNISDENIWAILINHLPRLRKEINLLIGD